MKLRNKKTGIKGELYYEPNKEYHFTVATDDPADMAIYRTLAELCEEWEDYEPTKPLIDNKEIREIIRAWADVNDAGKLKYNSDENSLDDIYRNTITFNRGLSLKDGHSYTITELCGEEEE